MMCHPGMFLFQKNLSKDKYFHKLFEVGRFHWAPVECGNLYNLIS
jgi:hypothetical protein